MRFYALLALALSAIGAVDATLCCPNEDCTGDCVAATPQGNLESCPLGKVNYCPDN